MDETFTSNAPSYRLFFPLKAPSDWYADWYDGQEREEAQKLRIVIVSRVNISFVYSPRLLSWNMHTLVLSNGIRAVPFAWYVPENIRKTSTHLEQKWTNIYWNTNDIRHLNIKPSTIFQSLYDINILSHMDSQALHIIRVHNTLLHNVNATCDTHCN